VRRDVVSGRYIGGAAALAGDVMCWQVGWRSGAAAFAVVLSACGANAAKPEAPIAPTCPTDHVIVLASQAEVARLARCTTASGVTIRSGAALDLSALRELAAITGDLVIGPTIAIDEISFGELRVVGGAIHVLGNGLLQGLYFPKLERAGRIEIDGNAVVTTISLPRLQVVHGTLRITDNASLELLDLSALASIDQDLVLAGDPRLTFLEAPELEHTAAVRLDVPKLPVDIAERLRRVAATPYVDPSRRWERRAP
jgi:hypothetical protein